MRREEIRIALERIKNPGEQLCNCGDAFYTYVSPESKTISRDGKWVGGYICEHGCGVNQLMAFQRLAEAFNKLYEKSREA